MCRTIALSHNGQFLAAGCADSSIILYDLQVYSRIFELYSEDLSHLKIEKLR